MLQTPNHLIMTVNYKLLAAKCIADMQSYKSVPTVAAVDATA